MKKIISLIFIFLFIKSSFSSENILDEAASYTVKIRTSTRAPISRGW